MRLWQLFRPKGNGWVRATTEVLVRGWNGLPRQWVWNP